jgi:soluble lytic murein transglycosylase-like protein
MKIGTVIAVTLCAATLAVPVAVHAESRKFTAAQASVKLKKPGKVVISNDSRTITAYRFFGNIREALVSIRSSRALSFRPFGSTIYNAHAPAKAPREYEAAIRDAAKHHGVDPRLVAAVARRESAWNPNAVSSVGACGLMQLMPATARYLGVANVFDPRENIFGGTRYLRTLLDTFNGDLDLALAAYNAGPGAVEKYRGVPPYKETKAYVAAVRASYEASLKNNG